MPVSAILLVGSRSLLDASGDETPAAPSAKPIACLKILGRSVLERTISRLHSAGVKAVTVISDEGMGPAFMADALLKQASKGFKKVLIIRLGAYAEVNYAELLKFHYQAGANVTRVCDADGPLDFWVVDPTPVVRSGIEFDSAAGIAMDQPLLYLTQGYVNRLMDARAIRRLAVDAFLGRCAVCPLGKEIKPGVWVARGAHVHRSARITGPVYVGLGSQVHSSAVVAGFSALEQCCVVDRGAVVEDASILPHTYIGKGLDVVHAVVDRNRFVHLRSDVAVTIDDGNIIGGAAPGWRSFVYGEKAVSFARPGMKPAGLVPVEFSPIDYAPSPQRPVLRLFSKGEV